MLTVGRPVARSYRILLTQRVGLALLSPVLRWPVACVVAARLHSHPAVGVSCNSQARAQM